MIETPTAEIILEIYQLLSQLVKLPMFRRITVNGFPNTHHAVVKRMGLAHITLQHSRWYRQTSAGQGADRFIIKRRFGQFFFQLRHDIRAMGMGAQHRVVAVAHCKFDHAILVGLETR